MTSATRSVAVVATRLPIIDRRALSQAWFSALHLAQPPSGTVAPRPASATPAVAARPRVTGSGALPAAGAPAARPQTAVRALPAGSVLTERRASAGDLARRIERAIDRHGAVRPLRTVTIAVNAGDGRVQLLVRGDGATTRIIALCAPHLRERVDRALAHARFALAAGGMRAEVQP
jgi:hypothetical protein